MKKILFIFVMMLLCILFAGMKVSADQPEDILSASGAEELDSGDILSEHGVTFDSPESILSLDPSEIWEELKKMLEDRLYRPVRTFILIAILIIAASLIESAGGTIRSKELSGIFELICVLSCTALIMPSVSDCLDTVLSAIKDGEKFMLGFVPVFSAMTAAEGSVTSASGYSFIVLGFSDIAIKLSESFFIPLLGMSLSLGIADACCDGINLTGLINAVKKIVTWGLGLVMTVFVGLLSIKSIVGTASDTLTLKTAKYLISNTVPLIGAAASEAYSSVKGSISLLKKGAGSIGIAAVCFMLLPPFIDVILYRAAFGLLGIISEIFGAKKLTALFKNINSVMSAAFSILVCFAVMFVIATGIVMTFCTPAV